MMFSPDWMQWYDALQKPSWTPAPATIGLIWQVLYPIIVITFGFVFIQILRKRLPWIVGLPFAINLIANLAFTPLQFGLQNLGLALLDIAIVWLTILWCMGWVWHQYRWVAWAQLPYLTWVTVATTLQTLIWLEN